MSFVFPDWLVPKAMEADLLAALGVGMSALGTPTAQISPQAVSFPDFGPPPISVEHFEAGTGFPAQAGDLVTVHFVVRTAEGKEIANTQKRGMPFSITIDGLASFWSTALEGVRVGGKSRLKANSTIFFGKNGVLPIIPADTDIEADLTVLRIQKPAAPLLVSKK